MAGELCDLGAVKLDEDTNALLVQCQSAELPDGEPPDFGELPVFGALGLVGVPYGADDRGSAQCIIGDLDGENGAAGLMRDTRATEILGTLEPGDTAMFATGPEFASQVRCQKKAISLITEDSSGDNCGIVIDGEAKKITIFGFGHVIEISAENGISLADNNGSALLLNTTATLKGAGVLLGEGASVPVAWGTGVESPAPPLNSVSTSILVPPA